MSFPVRATLILILLSSSSRSFAILVTAERNALVKHPTGRMILRGQSPSTRLFPPDMLEFTIGSAPSHDSTGGALAGYGDQRNYELFIEAGFTPAKAIQIMTLNGARILGVEKKLGTVEKGKLADDWRLARLCAFRPKSLGPDPTDRHRKSRVSSPSMAMLSVCWVMS